MPSPNPRAPHTNSAMRRLNPGRKEGCCQSVWLIGELSASIITLPWLMKLKPLTRALPSGLASSSSPSLRLRTFVRAIIWQNADQMKEEGEAWVISSVKGLRKQTQSTTATDRCIVKKGSKWGKMIPLISKPVIARFKSQYREHKTLKRRKMHYWRDNRPGPNIPS